ncbi:hypothetical protein GCM10010289_21010 [Streptomyces violascens]|uniref:Nudix hydrolase domain-containing protein n=1 Tax=Streptomyces violascens TaxID=67381 RepID=A0ABQ3QEQ9_9ACTN|nr:hypothetical protein GCM10010289_21010 [Streptomyces violascens]GHI35771.1 hypothetical protein Sviol_01790 [Streptomyces violascens]
MARTEYYDDPNAPEPNSMVVAASAVVTDDQGRILLQRRRDNGLWALPGGGPGTRRVGRVDRAALRLAGRLRRAAHAPHTAAAADALPGASGSAVPGLSRPRGVDAEARTGSGAEPRAARACHPCTHNPPPPGEPPRSTQN